MVANPMVLVEGAKLATDLVQALTDYLKCVEIEKTEREKVRALLEITIKQIKSNQKKFTRYLDHSFHEREKLYNIADVVLKDAIARSDLEASKLVLNFILTVYQKDPMAGIEKTQTPLGPGTQKYLG